jgi:iduronate 2-sulfatase
MVVEGEGPHTRGLESVDRRSVIAALGFAGLAFGLPSLSGCRSGDSSGDTIPSSTSVGATPPPVSVQPNVVYITADDLGVRLGSYGHQQVVSPRLDEFAADAVQFDRCYCQIALCTPSRSSILTGIRPETVGFYNIDDDWQALAPGAVSLFRNFRDGGYRTHGIGKIRDRRSGAHDDAWDELLHEEGISDVDEAVEMLRRAASVDDGRPFCVAVGFAQPHCPWEPTQASLDQYSAVQVEPFATGRTAPEDQLDCMGVASTTMSDADAVDVTRRYLASVTDIDTMFGALYDTIEELDLLENTIIVFWSGDHGYSLGENDSWGKWSLFESSVRIPLIVRMPTSGTRGTRVEALVEAVDMYPALIELCALPVPPQELEGVSFAPLLDEPTLAWKKAAFVAWLKPGAMAVKTEQHSFHSKPGDGFFDELYDLVEDPGETTNIINDLPDVRDEMVELLRAGWRAAVPS